MITIDVRGVPHGGDTIAAADIRCGATFLGDVVCVEEAGAQQGLARSLYLATDRYLVDLLSCRVLSRECARVHVAKYVDVHVVATIEEAHALGDDEATEEM